MVATSHFPDGVPDRCPVCQHDIQVDPSPGTGDAVCPFCGTLVWPPPFSADDFQSRPQLGDFQLLTNLGQAPNGSVYHGRQLSNGRQVTIWTLAREYDQEERVVQRFVREALAMSKLKHPNLLQVLGVKSVKGVHFVVTEFVEGRNMQQWFKRLHQLSVGDAVHLTLRVAEALESAHTATIVHRDLRPSNLHVADTGAVKVGGFGSFMTPAGSLTQSLSAEYMAPEQARNAKRVDGRSDIYALGTMLYEFVTGRPPFAANNTLELIMAKESGDYPPAASVNSEIPNRLDRVMAKMLARDPDDRHSDCAEVIEHLKSLRLENRSLTFIDSAG